MNFKIKNLCQKTFKTFQANIRLDEDVLKMSFVFVFRRRIDQDEYVRLSLQDVQDVLVMTNTFVLVIRLQDVLPKFFKTFSRHLTQTSSKHLQDVFITSSRSFAKLSSRRLQKVLKTSCKNVFKKSSRHIQDVLQRSLQRRFQDVSSS